MYDVLTLYFRDDPTGWISELLGQIEWIAASIRELESLIEA